MKPLPSLTEGQRRALALALEERWAVAVEARDGTRVHLRPGRPGCLLVLCLSSDEPPAAGEQQAA